MINIVKQSPQLGDPDDRKAPRGQAEAAGPPAASPAPPPPVQPDVRLVIEHDPVRDALIYKLIDRTTGEVVSELSREDLIKMSWDPNYAAGAVISTQA